jgi:hypothetical protein
VTHIRAFPAANKFLNLRQAFQLSPILKKLPQPYRAIAPEFTRIALPGLWHSSCHNGESMEVDMALDKEKILQALKEVYDPEIPVILSTWDWFTRPAWRRDLCVSR